MTLHSKCLALAVIASIAGASHAFSQSATSPIMGSKTMNESAGERRKAREEEAAQKQKRLEESNRRTLETVQARNQKREDCRRQAREQHLHFLKRVRFMRTCMASAPAR